MKYNNIMKLNQKTEKLYEINHSEVLIDKDGIYQINVTGKTNIEVKKGINAILKILIKMDSKVNTIVNENCNIGYYMISKAKENQVKLVLHENSFAETYFMTEVPDSKNLFEIDLIGYGAKVEHNNGAFLTKENTNESQIFINHLMPNTISNIVNRVVLNDWSFGKFNVKSYVKKGSSKSTAYQDNRIINLGDNSKVEIDPILLIDDYDIIGGHGASVSKVSDDDLYYLQSRGITKSEALKLISRGCLLENVPYPIKEEINEIIERGFSNE